MPDVTHLNCISCRREFRPDEIDYTCPDCGPLLGTQHVEYDYEQAKKELTKEQLAQNKDFTHWRYSPLLPISDASFIQPLAVGWTPMYRNDSLEQKLNLKSVRTKDDGRNTTASLKDRANSVAVVNALEKGAATVTAASTGNAASSWAVFTALANLRTVIFVPQVAPRAKVAQLLLYGAAVVFAEPASTAALAGLARMANANQIQRGETAVVMVTGHGLKDIDGLMRAVKQAPVVVENSLAEVTEKLNLSQ